MKLDSFQNASIEIKQIFFAYQQNRFTVNVTSIDTTLETGVVPTQYIVIISTVRR